MNYLDLKKVNQINNNTDFTRQLMSITWIHIRYTNKNFSIVRDPLGAPKCTNNFYFIRPSNIVFQIKLKKIIAKNKI